MASPRAPNEEQPFVRAAERPADGPMATCAPDECKARPAAAVSAPHEAPIACDLSVFTPAERQAHSTLFEEVVLGRARVIEELEDGYAYRYSSPADSETLLALGRWVANEQRCCPFLRFNLEVEPDGGPLVLRLQGRNGVKALLAAELDARGALARVQ